MVEKTIITNMCMVYDENGNVLVQDRVDPRWCGLTFPGGHLHSKESFVDSTIREVHEETGLRIENLKLCGLKHFFTENDEHYIVICYKTNCYSGQIVSSREGEVFWVKQEELSKRKLVPGMEHMLRLFLDEHVSEHYIKKMDETYIDMVL